MLRPRVIPCLLLHKGGLVKTQKFKFPQYVGDPINAVRIFNEKEADELMILDFDCTIQGIEPNYQLIQKLASECRMPLCYGGGIKSLEQAERIISLGVEKIAISSAALDNPFLIREIASNIGSQSVVVILDVSKKHGLFDRGYNIHSHNGKNIYKYDLLNFVKDLERFGVGEIVINSIDRDGIMNGYDLELAESIIKTVTMPVTMIGGAGSMEHISNLVNRCGLIGAAAGSLFVFKGKYRAVLINYPTSKQKDDLFCNFNLQKIK